LSHNKSEANKRGAATLHPKRFTAFYCFLCILQILTRSHALAHAVVALQQLACRLFTKVLFYFLRCAARNGEVQAQADGIACAHTHRQAVACSSALFTPGCSCIKTCAIDDSATTHIVY